MKCLVALIIVLCVLFPTITAAHASTSTSTSVAVRPGSFSATITFKDGVAVLTVIDATGSGNGWWVTVDCSCSWAPSGAIEAASSDPEQMPHWSGATLIAGSDQGMGRFQQTLLATPGQWLISSGQNVQP